MTSTAIAPTNIAILKYWGKNPAWEEYLIPTKSSLSFTVADLFTKTTVEAEKGKAGKIDFALNGKKITPGMKEYEYVADFLEKVGRFCPFVREYGYRIASENNFPTAAGFASSASGFAALIKSVAGELPEFANVKDDDRRLSALARLGSGSATRSIPRKGGFVLWRRGIDYPGGTGPEGMGMEEVEKAVSGSFAESLYGPEHWPELTIIYAKVKAEEKKVKSRSGMRNSVLSNPLYRNWVEYEENEMKKMMIDAFSKKDFAALAQLIMKASNNLHQICLGTYPPINYLKPMSLEIMDALHEMNEGGILAAYTFDAGPNPVIFMPKKNEKTVSSRIGEVVGGMENLSITRMGPGARFDKKHLF